MTTSTVLHLVVHDQLTGALRQDYGVIKTDQRRADERYIAARSSTIQQDRTDTRILKPYVK